MLEIPVRFTDLDLYIGENKMQNIGGKKSDWIDLRCAEDTYVGEFEFHLIPLGVAMQLPEGYEALLLPRSSFFKKYHAIQANSMGVIDEEYAGDNDEWGLPIYTLTRPNSSPTWVIPRGERICQFRIVKHQPDIEFLPVDHLTKADRGGFGSTGRV